MLINFTRFVMLRRKAFASLLIFAFGLGTELSPLSWQPNRESLRSRPNRSRGWSLSPAYLPSVFAPWSGRLFLHYRKTRSTGPIQRSVFTGSTCLQRLSKLLWPIESEKFRTTRSQDNGNTYRELTTRPTSGLVQLRQPSFEKESSGGKDRTSSILQRL